MRDILSLTEGQPLAVQIRSRRICPSLAAFLQLELFRVYTRHRSSRRCVFYLSFAQPLRVGINSGTARSTEACQRQVTAFGNLNGQ
ncbi:hypothetical protein B4923_10675 [Brenneria roseae subsp. americana]|uniref:Uncharacterized protein n=1 Tax=Brenneria roseae subsp. americana TaxID=1508507 RepID=A0A2U1TSC7_9GAMM|nr:hypothetical protein B4923_10675 [Brenneria roseae subsp. americana]